MSVEVNLVNEISLKLIEKNGAANAYHVIINELAFAAPFFSITFIIFFTYLIFFSFYFNFFSFLLNLIFFSFLL